MRSAFGLEADRGIDWLTLASCRDYPPEWWTVSSRQNRTQLQHNEQARAICRACPVQKPCADRAQRLGATGTIIAGREFRRAKRGYRRSYIVSLQCPGCRSSFDTRSSRQLYCSTKCRQRAYQRRVAA